MEAKNRRRRTAGGATYIYPKPELETLSEQRVASEQLAEAEEQLKHSELPTSNGT